MSRTVFLFFTYENFFPLCDASCGDEVFWWCGNNALTLSLFTLS